MRKIIASCVIFGICAGLFLSQNQREYADFKIAESTQNFAHSTQEANSSIFDEKSGLRSHERGNRTNGSLTKRVASLPDLSQKDAEFAYLPNTENSAHSSSITDLGDYLLVAYFAGSREGASDVKIMAHFVDKSTLRSTPPQAILSAQSLSNLTGKFIKKLGNPLIFKDANGDLHFFVVGVSLGGWATSKIYHLQLRDDLETLTLRQELRLGLLGNFSHLIRTPPLNLENGGFMLPLYHELARKYPLVAFFDERGNVTHTKRINTLKGQLQPTIIALNERECLAFFRNHKAHNNASFLQKCSRGGAIWESPSATNLKGWDDSYLLLNYKNAEGKSRILLLYNDGKIAESSNSRRSLGLYYLADSAKFAESRLDSATKTQQDEFIFLQNIDAVDKTYPNEVSYPSAVIDESALFVGYTYNRKAIKLQKIDLADIERKIAESSADNSVLGMQFRTCENFRTSTDSSLVESPKIFTNTKATPQSLPLRFCESQNLGENQVKIAESSKKSKKFCLDSAVDYHESANADSRNDEFIRDSSVALLPQNDKIMNFAESSAESTINYDIFGIYLLFLSAFFFATKSLSKRTKYLALPCFVASISIPFIFVLWDYYSIINLFYSLFGGTSVFCALLCARYILCKPHNSQNLALALAIFSIPLFLGHLDLISVDILRSEIASAIFASAFIVALFWADKVAFVLALIAVIIDRDFIFALFDGYLLIFSVIYCAIWAIKWSFKKIIARA